MTLMRLTVRRRMLMWVGSLLAILLAGRHFDCIFGRTLSGYAAPRAAFVMLAGLLFLVAPPAKAPGGLAFGMALAQSAISASFVAAPTIIAAAALPYRIRSQAFALLPVFVFLDGGSLAA